MKALWLLALLLACHVPAQQVTLPDDAIVFGEAFELIVTAPSDFDPGRLVPLLVELLDRTPAGQREPGQLEHWRFQARCYEVGDVILALDPPVQLTVTTALPAPRGELEWPSNGWLLEPPQSSAWLLLVLGAAAFVGLVWWRGKRTVPAAEAVAVIAAVPDWDAMAALHELLLPSNGACESYYQQLKAIVRRHCHARFRVPADVRTSEELVLALPRAQRTLQPCLATCDIVLFGGDLGVAQNHQGAKDAAIAFVAATSKAAMSTAEATG